MSVLVIVAYRCTSFLVLQEPQELLILRCMQGVLFIYGRPIHSTA